MKEQLLATARRHSLQADINQSLDFIHSPSLSLSLLLCVPFDFGQFVNVSLEGARCETVELPVGR